MSVTDPIADFLTRVRNGLMAAHETVSVPHSKSKEAIAKILLEEGYILDCRVEDSKPFRKIVMTMKYVDDREPAIRKLKKVSKPGRRVYVTKDEIPEVLGGLGINVLSTSKGVLTGKTAQNVGVGGELLFELY